MSDPHDIAADLRQAASWCRKYAGVVTYENRNATAQTLEALADSFDQPGPLGFDPDTGRMVRLEPAGSFGAEVDGWRFPSRGTSEGPG
jgi:hypothetical protein